MYNFIVKCFFCFFCLVSDYAYGGLNLNLDVYNELNTNITIAVNGIDVRTVINGKEQKLRNNFNLDSKKCAILNIFKEGVITDKDSLSISYAASNTKCVCKCGFKLYEGGLSYYPSLIETTSDVSIRLDDYGRYCLIISDKQYIDYQSLKFFR